MKKKYHQNFGGAREGAGRPRIHSGPMVNLTIYLPVEIIEKIDEISATMGISRSATARHLFRIALDPTPEV